MVTGVAGATKTGRTLKGYGLLDAVPAGTDLLYFAFVNYTTLGYGDVVPVERWQLL